MQAKPPFSKRVRTTTSFAPSRATHNLGGYTKVQKLKSVATKNFDTTKAFKHAILYIIPNIYKISQIRVKRRSKSVLILDSLCLPTSYIPASLLSKVKNKYFVKKSVKTHYIYTKIILLTIFYDL